MPIRIIEEAAAPSRVGRVRIIEAAPPPRKKGPMDYVTGLMANVNRGTGIGDELAGGASAALNTAGAVGGALIQGQPVSLDRIKTRFGNEFARQRQIEDTFSADHPMTAAAARGTGMAATVLLPTGAVGTGTRVVNMARGAGAASLAAGGYALADRGPMQQRLSAAGGAMVNPITLGLGAAGGALASVPRRANAGPRSNPQVLADEGVALTPGQRYAETPVVGGMIKNAEDLAQRSPILGPAIRGARGRSATSLVRAVSNRALAHIGERLPANVPVGHAGNAHITRRIGRVYDQAVALVPQVAPDAQFGTVLAGIRANINELPTDVGQQFDNIIANRITARLSNGPVTGRLLREIQVEIGGLAAHRGSSDDPAQQALGSMLEDVGDELGNLLGRANPQAEALIARANPAWANYVRLRNAGSKAKGGVPSPGQLSAAVRQMDRSVGKGRVAEGTALLQDLTDPAWQVMPDGFGNPGTADAASLATLLTLLGTKPEVGIPATAGLSAASVPYLLMGRGGGRIPQAPGAPGAGIPPALAARTSRAVGLIGGSLAAQGASTR